MYLIHVNLEIEWENFIASFFLTFLIKILQF